MSWKKLLESASEPLNDHLRLRNACLLAENRIQRNQIDGRVQLTAIERKELAELGAKLGKKALEEIATVAQPDTILAWKRKFADQKGETSVPRKSVGRPRVDEAIEALVVRMARENCSWGYDRIQGALHHLGYTVSDQTVGNILKRHGISPAPARKKTVTWQEFVRFHQDVLLATDFFSSEAWSWLGLGIASLFSFLSFVRLEADITGRMASLRTLLMRLISAWFFHVQSCIEKWIWRGKETGRRRLRLFGEDAQHLPLCALLFHSHRERFLHGRGTVVFLSAARPRPIRDGPMRHRVDRLLKDDNRKAA